MQVSKAAANEFRRAWKSLLLGVLLSVISSLASVTLMGAAGYFLTMMGVAGFLGVSCNIFILSALIRLCALLRTLLRYLERIINHSLTFKVIEKWRRALYDRVLSLPYDEAMDLQSHNVERTLRHDIAVIEALYIKEALPIFCAFILGLILGFVLWQGSVLLCLTALALMLLSSTLLPLLVLKFKGLVKVREALYAQRLQRQSGNLILGLFDLQSVGAVDKVLSRTFKTIEKQALYHSRFVFYEGVLEAVLAGCASLILPLAMLLLIPIYQSGELTGPWLISLAITAMASYEWLMPIPQAILAFKESLLSLRRIGRLEERGAQAQQVLKAKSLEHEADSACLADPDFKVQEVVFSKVSFKRGSQPIFKDFSYTFKSTENYLLQGSVGAGKTTLMQLFAGVSDPDAGTISADGILLGSFNQDKWRSHYALSLQEIAVLPGTIREILTEVKKGASDEECWQALEKAQLKSVVEALPERLNAFVDAQSLSLSGGELRRLCLARALMVKKEFLILDEPLEGLDESTSQKVMENAVRGRGGVIIISHKALNLKLDNLNLLQI